MKEINRNKGKKRGKLHDLPHSLSITYAILIRVNFISILECRIEI